MRAIPAVADAQFGVFSRKQAIDEGWTRSSLLHAVRTGELSRMRPGVFIATDCLIAGGTAARCVVATVSALLSTPAAVASHASAAVLDGLPVWRLPNRPCLTVVPRYTGDASDAHLHRAALPTVDLRRDMPLARTSATRTVIDLAREHGIEQAIVTGDAALQEGATTISALVACASRCRRWPGIRRAAHAVTLLDGRAESPIESVSRLRLLRTSLPPPDLQPDILSAGGVWLGRPDFYWDDVGVVGEVDGKVKYAGPANNEALWQEKLRQERLENAGLIVVRWGYADLGDLTHLTRRLRAARRRGGLRPLDERQWVVRRSKQDDDPPPDVAPL